MQYIILFHFKLARENELITTLAQEMTSD